MGKKKRDELIILKRATQGRGFQTPNYSPGVRNILVVLGKWYLRHFEGVDSVEIKHETTLMQEFARFDQKKTLLILAFRHVAKEDAPTLMYALNRNLQRQIKKAHPTNRHIITHAQFLYGKDVLNWAGSAAAWLFPKIGCVPVQNRGSNKQGLDILRKAMNEGDFPIALAPESQVTYHMYRTSGLSQGVASLAYWGTLTGKEVTILPIAIAYRHAHQSEDFIRSVLLRWEKQTGKALQNRACEPILDLLATALQETLSLLEDLYHLEADGEQRSHEQRIKRICEKALSEAESLCELKAEGSFLDRVFRIRFKGEEAVHPDLFDPKKLPLLSRSIADFRSLQAHVYLRHAQIVDILQYLDLDYLQAPCSEGRACEFALNLLDVINRMQGGNIASRFTPKHKKAVLFIGKAITLEGMKKPLSRKQGLMSTMDKVYASLQKTSEELESYWEKNYFKH
ncbi:MAG: hypothetical protein WC136_08630 [Sphaerochaeta sp.]|nr:hypothetical protein [Sphaerochaeta sp.]